ncbi:nicotinate-nucleotide--dimethylbenzimidazole phosphoribosyltransferase [Plasticicumulans acidivorans]|uniref:Nicotinate-nucleotide--dimethylbenzimidazole phosphoribosyltransferase n=1 Tax=Plasticicumulans acidivorans TaxID=886464 RepID=A0A317MYL8_9GAMM|nr:nicotinate-nucleotide--dimethylbenzimidazole phosphoribosyltransferase [Plasticicumulans acidivorans]PWV64462.1 nicotinate-nucleotide-dimethylbenzimidazole phosphoribosyltransferase [Plasticicumulans acidivorans]
MSIDWLADPIPASDRDARLAALQRQMQLTKPAGALGRLEALAVRLAGLQRCVCPQLERVRIVVFAADHGVAAAGVSAYPQAVTAEMVRNFARGGAAISVLARTLGAELEVVNVGTVAALEPLAGVIDARVGPGTANFVRAPAMSDEQLEQALAAGRTAAERAMLAGAQLFIGGEMGIGNTTAAAALAAALLGLPTAELVGPGTGLDAAGVAAKIRIVDAALARAQAATPLAALRELGGFEIAALAAAYLAAAQRGVPSLVDGFITSVAALVALRMQPELADWLLFAHRSAEPGHRHVLAACAAEPLLELGLRLGEGSGAALALPLLRSACTLHGEMATFAEAGVSQA